MSDKAKRREIRQREKYKRLKEKEYTKEYLQVKRDRDIFSSITDGKPNNYPIARLVLLKDFIRAGDLYKALALFAGSQVSLFVVASAMKNPKLTGLSRMVSILIGIICIMASIRIINQRQKIDITRRKVRKDYVFKTLCAIIFSVIVSSIIFSMLNIPSPKQPNQEVINNLIAQFPLAIGFSLVLVAPVVEETVFRELIPYATGPSYLSFILTSLIFIIMHTPSGVVGWVNYGIITAAFLGIRLKNNNVYAGIYTHIIWNALTLIPVLISK